MYLISATIWLSGVVLLASAQTSNEIYINDICTPVNSSNLPDMNAPCNALQAVQDQCVYGPKAGIELFYSEDAGIGDSTSQDGFQNTQSNRTQQICVCESQMFALWNGCIACYVKHGDPDRVGYISPAGISSVSASYCQASVTPTINLGELLARAVDTTIPWSVWSAATQTNSFTDPIGNKTEVSYYFTPSVSGTAAWMVTEVTGAAIPTLSGQIVPPSVAAAVTAGSLTSHGAGTKETAAVMGVMGLLGVVAML